METQLKAIACALVYHLGGAPVLGAIYALNFWFGAQPCNQAGRRGMNV